MIDRGHTSLPGLVVERGKGSQTLPSVSSHHSTVQCKCRDVSLVCYTIKAYCQSRRVSTHATMLRATVGAQKVFSCNREFYCHFCFTKMKYVFVFHADLKLERRQMAVL